MGTPGTQAQWSSMGKAQLQHLILSEFPVAKHMRILVEAADEAQVVLRAPLAPNANHAGSAFGGSLFSVAVLAGWAWLTRHLVLEGIQAEAVIQESHMRYLKPVRGELRAVLAAPPHAEIEKFRRMLRRSGRGRIRLHVDVLDGRVAAARLEGTFAAAIWRA